MSALIRQRAAHLDLALRYICYHLQLPEPLFVTARDKYNQVGRWLTETDSPVLAHRPRVFHQGSMLLETTVKPLARVEYDLDVICQLRAETGGMSPRQVFDLVWKRLSANPEYKGRLKPKDRCIRVNFPDKFHLDVVPAIIDGSRSATSLYIPDLPADTGKWKASDPEGFAAWFEEMCKKMVFQFSVEARASVDPIPDPQPYNQKRPLKRAVQLIKRWRDKWFHGNEELNTPSIVVTRLAGDAYEGEQTLLEAVGKILDRWHLGLAKGRPRVYNPVNDKELISEKWERTPESFEAFRAAIANFRERWKALPGLSGIQNIAKELSDLFGDVAATAVKESFEQLEAARQEQTRHVTRDTVTLLAAPAAGAIKVKGHTFHGD